jgi:hypothetical protein
MSTPQVKKEENAKSQNPPNEKTNIGMYSQRRIKVNKRSHSSWQKLNNKTKNKYFRIKPFKLSNRNTKYITKLKFCPGKYKN